MTHAESAVIVFELPFSRTVARTGPSETSSHQPSLFANSSDDEQEPIETCRSLRGRSAVRRRR